MKKIYIIPTASFEPLEDENLMISGSTRLQDKTTAESEVTKNNPPLSDLDVFNGNNTGGMSEYDEESDD